MAEISKQTVFMLAIYIVILIIMYSLVGINIQSGKEKDKTVPWLLYGFSFIGALGTFFALKKFTGGFKHKVRMIVYGIFLFAFVLGLEIEVLGVSTYSFANGTMYSSKYFFETSIFSSVSSIVS